MLLAENGADETSFSRVAITTLHCIKAEDEVHPHHAADVIGTGTCGEITLDADAFFPFTVATGKFVSVLGDRPL